MQYIVKFDEPELAAAAIDEGTPSYELADALVHACRLLDEERHNVTIGDDAGHSISGDDLAACCRGDKEITADLRAISN
jgi:hypothetical protein